MKVATVIAEYNPFHNGHAYHIEKTKELSGATHIIAVMSGNFVQRGEPALFSKWTRARAALMCGADLIIELPTPWAMSGAEAFSRGAVGIAKATGCTDLLSFGSESGNIEKIWNVAQLLVSDNFVIDMRGGAAFATARQNSVAKVLGDEFASLLSCPNDTLGVEYSKAIISQNADIKPVAVKRVGAWHDSQGVDNSEYVSASQLRKSRVFAEFVPAKAEEIYLSADCADIKYAERAVLYNLRNMSADDILQLPDISEGLENRIYSAARSADSLEALYSMVKTKRYSHARIRRIVLASFLGLKKGYNEAVPSYIRVLGFNDKGADILREMKKKATLPIVTKGSAVPEYEQKITDIYGACFKNIKKCGIEFTEPIIKL